MQKIASLLTLEPTSPAPAATLCEVCGHKREWAWLALTGTWRQVRCEVCEAAQQAKEVKARREAVLSAWRKQYSERVPAPKFARRVEVDARLAAFVAGPASAWLPGQCGIYLSGETGTGKTQALVEAGHRLVELLSQRDGAPSACPVWYASIPTLLQDLKAGEVELTTYQRAPWLLLDEIGAAALTDWHYDLVNAIISSRYDAGRPTLYASNRDLADLLNGAVVGWDARLTTRISEMIGGFDGEGYHAGQIALTHNWRMEARR